MNQILYNTTNTTDKKKIALIVLVVLVFAIVCLSTLFALMNLKNTKIINNVFISGIDVSGKTTDEAREILRTKMEEAKNKKLVLKLDGSEYDVVANELGFDAKNLEIALLEAYNYGRDKTFIRNNYTILFSNFKDKEIDLDYTLDEELYYEFSQRISSANPEVVADDKYEISEDKVIITRGQDGMKIDKEALEEAIITTIIGTDNSLEIPIIESKSGKIDFDKLYSEVHVAPQDASFTSGDKFEVVVDKTGIDFDKTKAIEEYNDLKNGETMTIALNIVEPKVKVADLDNQLFKDTLSTFSTKYDTTETNRVKNLQTASDRCNGTIVYPGQEFSFHKTIGTRTIANGYASAHSFAGGRVVNTVGGGICQVSSTLYNIVLHADLEVTERKAHGMYVTYAEPSVDATISEGAIDFKFKNNRNYPIKIVSTMNNGTLTMSILGIKESTDKIIEIESVVLETLSYKTIKENDSSMLQGTTKVVQEPVNGYVSEAYRVEKDANGNIVSRTLISKDKYIPTNEIIKIGTKVNTPVVKPDPIPEPTEEEKEPERELPPGWDSPESPYGN